MNIYGTDVRQLTNNTTIDKAPAVSPNGKFIAYYNSDWLGNPELYLMNIDGTGQHIVPNTSRGRYPSWSPDSSFLVYEAWVDGSSRYEIYTCQLDGSNLVNLTNTPSSDQYPSVSPDGKYISFLSFRSGSWQLHRMSPNGSNVTQLTTGMSTPDVYSRAAWSPDSTTILFPQSHDIYAIGLNGTGLRNLTRATGIDSEPNWYPAIPKKKFITLIIPPLIPPVISASNASISEGNTGRKDLVFPVFANRNKGFTVDYYTSDGSATVADNDYLATSGTLVIPVGQREATVAVQVIGDTYIEEKETIHLNLNNPSYLNNAAGNRKIVIGQPLAIGTIKNDDHEPPPDLTKRYYYLYKRSGSGYRRPWAGTPPRHSGYDYFYKHIRPTEAQATYDAYANFAERTTIACEAANPPSGYSPYPDIWDSGTLVRVGIFENKEDLDPYRCSTHSLDYNLNIICNQWAVDYDKDYWPEVTEKCGW